MKKRFAIALVLACATFALAWLALGRLAVEKLVTTLAMPAGLVWLLLAANAWICWIKVRGPLRLVGVVTWAVFTLACSPLVATLLVRERESRFAAVEPLAEDKFDAVVVLGGGANEGANQRSQGNASGDRLILAAQLWHQGLTERIICTGKNIAAFDRSGIDAADRAEEILMQLGVPVSAIERFGGRNTAEEMGELGSRFSSGRDRVGLITSAWHMPRALTLAQRHGFEPQPLPCNFLSGPVDRERTAAIWIADFLPSSGALERNSKILKEHLASLVGR